jgi:hypothetical protein
MANADRPSGLRPVGKIRRVQSMVAGATCYPGDALQLKSDGKCDPAAAGETIFGVALSYATDGQNILVSTDPEQLYAVQCDGSAIDAQTDIGNNVDLLATAGDSTYKVSRMEVDTSTVAAGAAQCTIMEVERRVGNAFGDLVDVIVRINEHQVNKDAFAGV